MPECVLVASRFGIAMRWNMPNYYVTEHFMLSDFICPCCDLIKITPGFYRHVELLQKLRQEVNFPIIINSGYRCNSYNKTLAGGTRSWHLLFATDIKPEDRSGEKLANLFEVAQKIGFMGIGLAEYHVHLDMRPSKLIWRQ